MQSHIIREMELLFLLPDKRVETLHAKDGAETSGTISDPFWGLAYCRCAVQTQGWGPTKPLILPKVEQTLCLGDLPTKVLPRPPVLGKHRAPRPTSNPSSAPFAARASSASSLLSPWHLEHMTFGILRTLSRRSTTPHIIFTLGFRTYGRVNGGEGGLLRGSPSGRSQPLLSPGHLGGPASTLSQAHGATSAPLSLALSVLRA